MKRSKSFLDDMGAEFGFCHEKINGKGEDSCCYSYNEIGGIMAVFDGCGGSGSRTYPYYRGRSGAYLASRLVAAATMEWVDWYWREGAGQVLDVTALKRGISEMLAYCEQLAQQPESRIRGMIARTLPTTMSALVFQRWADGKTLATAINAGDSRLYLLDPQGLKQLTRDDAPDEDAFDNLYADPPHTNVISLHKPFELGVNRYWIPGRCVLLGATDGCFGYLQSPMEFEFLFLSTLMESRSIDEWQHRIEERINAVAGDDQTLMGLVYGYRSFAQLRKAFEGRYAEMKRLLAGIDAQGNDSQKRKRLWESYRQSYYSWLFESERCGV